MAVFLQKNISFDLKSSKYGKCQPDSEANKKVAD